MLTRLSIRDIVLIDRLDIDFAAGLSVLTGETGAGKSILLDAFALALGARGDVALVWEDRRTCEAALAAKRAEVERAQREADWLRHAVEELAALKPAPAEETALAERRTAMMAAEKVAGDLRDAHEAVAGSASPVPALAAAVRRLERRSAQAPALIEPSARALDAALSALEDARAHLDEALRQAEHDPHELEKIEERLFALRAAARKYNVPVDELKALAARSSAPTLVFDEVDTGVGGAVADAIGVRLARLSRRAQVIAVTHAPQVAARADRHYLITKDALAKGKRVATRVAEVSAERRREEIARMLAGAEITAEARAAAERLIKAAS